MKKYLSLAVLVLLCACKSEYHEKLEEMVEATKQFHTEFASKNNFKIDFAEFQGIKYDTLNLNDLDSMRYYLLYDKFQFYKKQIEENYQVLEALRGEIEIRKKSGATEASQANEIEAYNRIKALFDGCVDSLKTIKAEQDLLIQHIEQRTDPEKVYRMKYYMKATVKHDNGAIEQIMDTLDIYFNKDYQMIKGW